MSFGIMAHPVMAGLFYAFLSRNVIIIALVVVLYFVLYFFFKKNRAAIYEFLENNCEIKKAE